MRLRVQSILYNSDAADVARAAQAIDNAAHLAIDAGLIGSAVIAWGDCSPTPCFDDGSLAEARRSLVHGSPLEYRFFDANLGSAQGHNRLSSDADADLVMTLNPDVVAEPKALCHMISVFKQPGAGFVEGRQLPIEHPKDYDPISGETPWAATACAITPKSVFAKLGGFDHETFFLYCDDVDYSWRVRLAGLKVLFAPAAAFFHDKRLGRHGDWQAGAAEKYFSAEAALMMAHKYSRPDMLNRYLSWFKLHGEEHHQRAAEEYERRLRENLLPTPIDPEGQVGYFAPEGGYAPHRFSS